MASSRACNYCRKTTACNVDELGKVTCTSCGLVLEFDDLQAQLGGINGPTGTNIHTGTSGSGTVHNYKEIKVYHALNLIQDFMSRLGFSPEKSEEVRLMVHNVTEGEYGQGQWFPVLIGACSYVVMRKDHKMLPVGEVADAVGCDVYELGRMIGRVVDFFDLKLPEFDIVNAFERSLKNCPSFSDVEEDLVKRMLQQGVFLVQCLIKWFITTGRRPMPVVAAVLVFVAELNQVDVKIEDLAMELHIATATCRRRYKELLERLVEVARNLPWGKDVTVKNILKNASSVMQYMELKSCSRENKSIEGFNCDVEGLVEGCLSKQIGYGYDTNSVEEDCSSKYFEMDSLPHMASENPDKFQISPESLSLVYTNYLEELSLVEANGEVDAVNRRRRQKTMNLQHYSDWWSGESDMSKRLILKKILAKDVGLNPSPPSFDRACLSRCTRREKIKAAKLRILRVMHPRIAGSVQSNEVTVIEPEKSRKKRRKDAADIGWEDLIIETLLLHNVKEEEIEKGHYNTLMDLHVFGYIPLHD